MNAINDEFLERNGFQCNHPDYVMKKWSKNGVSPEWRVSLEPVYTPMTNKLSYNVDCWRCNDKGAIIKRGSLSYVTDYEDVVRLCDICDIDVSTNN